MLLFIVPLNTDVFIKDIGGPKYSAVNQIVFVNFTLFFATFYHF